MLGEVELQTIDLAHDLPPAQAHHLPAAQALALCLLLLQRLRLLHRLLLRPLPCPLLLLLHLQILLLQLLLVLLSLVRGAARRCLAGATTKPRSVRRPTSTRLGLKKPGLRRTELTALPLMPSDSGALESV